MQMFLHNGSAIAVIDVANAIAMISVADAVALIGVADAVPVKGVADDDGTAANVVIVATLMRVQ